ncbi:MAG: hypothetical protein OIN66_04205 [Candidatus Methanoperedens sp.]|nr:hypothetical protein [Candidatus Methanoperedens sp.]
MQLSKKNKLLLFILLIILSLISRLFAAEHEMMLDSYEMHLLANSISKFGEARWWLSPLSIVGLYPNSYASATPFLLSGTSQIIGSDIEFTIFIYSTIFGVFSIFVSYILAGAIYKNDFYKYIVSFGYSLSPGILTYTTWTANARSPFIIILPLLIFSLFYFKKNWKFKLLTIILLVLLLSIHHLVFYTFPFFFAYFILEIYIYLSKYKFWVIRNKHNIENIVLLVLFITLMSYSFSNNKFQSISGRWNNLGYLLNEYPRYIGILILLSLGGMFYLILKSNKTYEELLLLFLMISISPFYFDERYMKWFILIFASLLAGIGFLNLRNIKTLKGKNVSIIMLFMIMAVIFSGYFQYIHQYKSDKGINNNEYESASWIRKFADKNFISNARFTSWKISSISGSTFLTGSATSDQAYELVDAKGFELKAVPFTSEEFWLDSPYIIINGTVSDNQWQIIMERKYDSSWAARLLKSFNITMFLEDTTTNGAMSSHRGQEKSDFVWSVRNYKENVYDSGDLKIWVLS